MKDALVLSASYFYEEKRYERLLSLVMAIKDGCCGEEVIKKISEINDTEGHLTVTWRNSYTDPVTEENRNYVTKLWSSIFSEYCIEHRIYNETR